MAQVKKEEVERAILAAAFKLFKENGYNGTTLPEIGRKAGISTANVYNYFPSKMDLLFQVYEPWLIAKLDELDMSLKTLRAPRSRLRRILTALWQEIPSDQNGFASNIMQALTSSNMSHEHNPRMRNLIENRIAHWLETTLPPSLISKNVPPLVANLVLMAFDGFAINCQLSPAFACDTKSIDLMITLLLRE